MLPASARFARKWSNPRTGPKAHSSNFTQESLRGDISKMGMNSISSGKMKGITLPKATMEPLCRFYVHSWEGTKPKFGNSAICFRTRDALKITLQQMAQMRATQPVTFIWTNDPEKERLETRTFAWSLTFAKLGAPSPPHFWSLDCELGCSSWRNP